MAVYRIAGHLFSMNPRYKLLQSRAEKYLYEGPTEGKEIIDIDITQENFEKGTVSIRIFRLRIASIFFTVLSLLIRCL